jgi:mannosyl-oligosaccharide alpha-1,2-mannosidase
LNVTSQKPATGDRTNGLATIGTLVLEWTRLSDKIGDPQYARLSQRAEQYLLRPQPASSEPWPGLVGTNVNIDTGAFTNNYGGWNGGDDSFYEYLIKMYVYDPKRFGQYRDRWIAAADSTIRHLTTHPSTRPDLTYVAGFTGQTTFKSSQHLTCFDGGNFLLGGRVLNRPDYVQYGLSLTAGCYNTYASTVTGIGPEQFGWDENRVPDDQKDFFEKHGFYILSGAYVLRPEVLESYYYAYRVTGDTRYQDWAWNGFVAINATCWTPAGFSAIADVNKPGGGAQIDNEESFAFAEMLKYAYIIHAGEQPWQVGSGTGLTDQFVFNTEAHPIRVAAFGGLRKDKAKDRKLKKQQQ